MAASDPATAARRRRSNLKAERIRSSWIFLAPMLAVLAFVAGWPLLKTIWFGFTDASLDALSAADFIGLNNYLEWVDYGDGEGDQTNVNGEMLPIPPRDAAQSGK